MTTATLSPSINIAELSGRQRQNVHRFVQDHFQSKACLSAIVERHGRWDIYYAIGAFSNSFEVSESFLRDLLKD